MSDYCLINSMKYYYLLVLFSGNECYLNLYSSIKCIELLNIISIHSLNQRQLFNDSIQKHILYTIYIKSKNYITISIHSHKSKEKSFIIVSFGILTNIFIM